MVSEPGRVRDLAKASGKVAKTDGIDAQVLARYGGAVRPQVRALASAAAQELQALVRRRQQLVERVSVAGNRRSSAGSERVHAPIDRHLAGWHAGIKNLDEQRQAHLNQLQQWQQRQGILRSVPGVGVVTASTLVARLPELGHEMLPTVIRRRNFSGNSLA